MNDWLDQRLQDGAARAVGDVSLGDPSSVSTEDAPGTVGADVSTEPGGTVVHLDDVHRARSAPLLAVAAAVVVLVAIGAWIVTRDGSTAVDSTDPAGSGTVVASVPDGPPAEVVGNALQRTMSTSWVADAEVGNDDGSAELSIVTYNPADPTQGRPYATVLMATLGSAQMALGSGPGLVEACAESDAPPCRPGAWVEDDVWNAEDFGVTEDEYRQLIEASLTLIANIDPASATATETAGEFEVTLSALAPCDVNCTATVEVRDGYIVSLSIPGNPDGSRRYSYADFGSAPEVDEPAPADIVEGPLRPTVLCEVTLSVGSAADTDSIEARVRSLEADLGNEDGAALMRAIRAIPGVLDVSTTTSDGCTSDTVSIGFVTEG